MPARRADVAPSPDERLLRLRGRLQELLPGPDAPDSPLRQVLGDPSFVVRVAPLAARAVRAGIRRLGRAGAAAARRGGSARGRPVRRRARRRPLALAAVAAVLAAAWLAARSAHRPAARV